MGAPPFPAPLAPPESTDPPRVSGAEASRPRLGPCLGGLPAAGLRTPPAAPETQRQAPEARARAPPRPRSRG
eukprot:15461573-Alexandrium_andersonii.AAC.1